MVGLDAIGSGLEGTYFLVDLSVYGRCMRKTHSSEIAMATSEAAAVDAPRLDSILIRGVST